jgi:hypothetical protein
VIERMAFALKTVRLRHTNQQTALDCITLINRIDALIRPA